MVVYIHMHIYTHTCICISHIFIHSSVDRHFGCFHILATVSNAAMNIGVPVSFQINVVFCYFLFFFKLVFLDFSDIYPMAELLDHMVVLFLLFLRNICIIFHSGYMNLHFYLWCMRDGSFFSI